MSTSLVVRSASDTYRILCSHCGHHREIKHHQLPLERRKFRVTCECGHVSRVLFERRRDVRKPVQLKGYLFALGTKEQRDELSIGELSIGGVGLTSTRCELQVGDRFTIGFFLDDDSAAWIEQDIEVRMVPADGLAGAEFINPEQYSVDLDFYLINVSLID